MQLLVNNKLFFYAYYLKINLYNTLGFFTHDILEYLHNSICINKDYLICYLSLSSSFIFLLLLMILSSLYRSLSDTSPVPLSRGFG